MWASYRYEHVMGALRRIEVEGDERYITTRFPEYWSSKEIKKARKLRVAVLAKEEYLNAKERAFVHYCNGPPCCAHCGISDLRVLVLHHIDGDGKEHREKYNGTLTYTRLEREGYPKGLLSLCSNCHIIVHSKN